MHGRLLAIAVGGLVLLSGAAVEAGHGHGGWHVDFFYGGGWPGPYYRPWPYYNYVYVAPPPVVYAPPPVVTVPALTSVQTAPITASNSSPTSPAATATVRANAAPALRTGGVTIRNPAASGTPIAFVVDSRTEAELAPGETMPLTEKNSYFLEFDRGGDFGTSKRTLSEGTYEFVATENGWDLRRADDTDPVPTPIVKRNALPTVK